MPVHLIGAGPGDAALITLRGLGLIRGCDVLVHDPHVADQLVAEAPDRAFVVDRSGLGQLAVNELLIAYGRAELDVVRLREGTALATGDGGEEARALAAAGIPYRVVPGA